MMSDFPREENKEQNHAIESIVPWLMSDASRTSDECRSWFHGLHTWVSSPGVSRELGELIAPLPAADLGAAFGRPG
jgi:hypothetical protein